MKTTFLTFCLTIVFLSAGAFAGNAHLKLHHYDAGFSVAYKTQI